MNLEDKKVKELYKSVGLNIQLKHNRKDKSLKTPKDINVQKVNDPNPRVK